MEDDLKTLALRLLERDPPPGPIMAPNAYVPGSLPDLIAMLARPEVVPDAATLCSLCLAYCHAYVYPEHFDAPVSLAAATVLAGQFVRRRGGSRQLAGQDALRRFLLHHGFALQMLLDLPKTAHLLAAVLSLPLGAPMESFLGLDLGSGTGILLLGQYLLARRAGYATPFLIGIEHLAPVADRANALLTRLGVGQVIQADATQAAPYQTLPSGPIACITNETLPSAGRRLYKEPFPRINEVLFATLGARLVTTVFLPEVVWASDRQGQSWLRLAPENAFAGNDTEKPLGLYWMRDVELAGTRVPVERVGEQWLSLVSEPWRQTICRRW